MTHTIVTAIISLLSLTSISLAYYSKTDLRRYACLFGLAAQPFWIAHVVMSEAWGILLLTPAYTLLYVLAWSMATRICIDREAQWRSDLSKLIDGIIADGERQLDLERNKHVD